MASRSLVSAEPRFYLCGLSAGICIALLATFRISAFAGTFPDAHDVPTAGWTGPVFKLSQDYPTALPVAGTMPWKSFNFRTQPELYVRSVLAYCLEGNVGNDFELEKNTVRKWYHAPWMHSTASGREFVHGLTRERGSRPHELHPSQSGTAQNWAVGMYNARGGYTIGQVWKDPNQPDATAARFRDGTVAFKLLFTDADPAQVPYLQNSFEWQADINPPGSTSTRTIRTVRLLQVDVAVRDTRAANTTGWVYGTFVYDGNAPGSTPFDRLVPVGVMWGNDPSVTQAAAGPGVHLRQTWINPAVGPPQHLGRAGRLNGPVDNPISSCLSCHSTAQYVALSRGTPPAGATDAQAMRWFRNIRATTPFDAGQQSLGYSLQLATGIQRFLQAHPTVHVVAISSAHPSAKPIATIRRGDP